MGLAGLAGQKASPRAGRCIRPLPIAHPPPTRVGWCTPAGRVAEERRVLLVVFCNIRTNSQLDSVARHGGTSAAAPRPPGPGSPLTFTGKGLQLIWQPGSALGRSGQSPPPQ